MKSEQDNGFVSAPYDRDATSPRRTLGALGRHKMLMLFIFMLVLAMVMVPAYLAPPVYQSEAELLYRLGREKLALDPTVNGPILDLAQSMENEINSELAILKSRQMAERVVDALGPERVLGPKAKSSGWMERVGLLPELPTRENAIGKMLRRLKVEVAGKSNIIDVAYQASTPSDARDVLNELIQVYLDRHVEIYAAQAPPRFFEEQVRQLSTELVRKEEEIKQYRLKHSISAPERQRDVLLTQISSLERLATETGSQIQAAAAKITSFERTLANRPERLVLSEIAGKTNFAADSMKGRLIELQQKEADLVARYQPDARVLANVRKQIALLETSLAGEHATLTEVTTGLDTNFQALQLALATERAQLKADTERRKALLSSVGELRSQLDALTENEVELTRLQREQGVQQGDYLQASENLRRVRLSLALDMDKISSVRTVQPATLSPRPIKPQRLLMLAIAVALGLIGAFSVAVFAEACHETPHPRFMDDAQWPSDAGEKGRQLIGASET